MIKKEKMILDFLYQTRERYVTSKEIAEHVETSDRTIRTYIKRIVSENENGDFGFTIDSKQGLGYRLIIHNKKTFHKFMEEADSFSKNEYAEAIDRQRWLLEKLMLKEEAVLFDHLEEQLFVSRSTLSSDFKKLRELLLPYNLRIESKPYKGAFIVGEERDKRHFIMTYFFGESLRNNLVPLITSGLLSVPVSIESIIQIVLDECRNAQLKLSDYVIQNVAIHIALAIQRVEEGFILNPISLDKKRFTKELEVATKIVNRLKRDLKTPTILPIEEIDYIALHLITSSKNDKKRLILESQLKQELYHALVDVDMDLDLHYSADQNLIDGLSNHLQVLLERLANHIHLDNPLKQDIMHKYPTTFEDTKKFLKSIPTLAQVDLSDDEVAYVTLHLLASLERQKEKVKANILVICSTGYGSAQMLKHRIENELGEYINIVDVISYFDLKNELLVGIDAILTTIDLSNLIFTVPVLTVSVFLSEEEVAEAKKLLRNKEVFAKKQMPCIEGVKSASLEEEFDRYFFQTGFLKFREVEKSLLIEKMVGEIAPDTGTKTQLLNLIQEREKLSSVIFDSDIAVPHPLKPVTEEHQIVVAIVEKGVVWEEGYEDIKLVFLVSPSIYSNEGLKVIIDRLTDIVDSPEVKRKLVYADDYRAFKNIFLARTGVDNE